MDHRQTAADTSTQRLGDLLVRSGRITSAQLERALAHQRRENLLIGQALVEVGAITESVLSEALREQGKLACIRLTPEMLDPVVARELGPEAARRLSAVPVNRIAGISTVAMVDPMDLNSVDEIANTLKTRILPVHAEPQQITACLAFVHDHHANSGGGTERESEQPAVPAPEQPHLAQQTINMVQNLLADAASLGATSLHVEPRRQGYAVRFRAKGLFSDRLSLSRDWGPACVARLKWMARLDLLETRQIQEGHARTTVLEDTIALSVATTPGLQGEGVVVRLLPAESEIGPLDSLGLEPGQLTRLRGMISKQRGLLLAGGPAGSGRTELLYSFLCELNQPERKLVTLEEAVRYPLDGVTQVPVQAGLGLGFASALRAILRQDPDVVLLGEMRDGETAAAASRAALSGRLLLATLEARWPRDVIPRLLELGVETACVAEALAGVVHQRTVRTICSECRTPERPDPELLERLGCSPFEAFRGTGCTRCRQTGYLGEAVIRELLPVTVQVRRNILRCASAEAIHDAAREGGGPSLKEDALRLARAGRTTLEEVLRATDAGP